MKFEKIEYKPLTGKDNISNSYVRLVEQNNDYKNIEITLKEIKKSVRRLSRLNKK